MNGCWNCKHASHYKQTYMACECKGCGHWIHDVLDICDEWEPI